VQFGIFIFIIKSQPAGKAHDSFQILATTVIIKNINVDTSKFLNKIVPVFSQIKLNLKVI
jgi:hypothetical protein